jgi:hypothetical protein
MRRVDNGVGLNEKNPATISLFLERREIKLEVRNECDDGAKRRSE